MRVLLAVLLALATRTAFAEEPPRGRAELDVIVPVDPSEHERLHFFGRGDHHVVPGTVTINDAPYQCDPHQLRFRDRDAFLAHLRTVHRATPDRIPDSLVVVRGRVHFVGE